MNGTRVAIRGADHVYTGRDDTVAQEFSAWLRRIG